MASSADLWHRQDKSDQSGFLPILSLIFLPLDLWATAKAKQCDTYFLEFRVKD